MNFTEEITNDIEKTTIVTVKDYNKQKPQCSSELTENLYIQVIQELTDEILLNTYEKEKFFRDYLYRFSDSTYRFGLCARSIQSDHKRKICPFDYRVEFENNKERTELYFRAYESEESSCTYKCSRYCKISAFVEKNNANQKSTKLKEKYADKFWKMIESTLKNFKRR